MHLDIVTPSGTADAYLARPSGGEGPGVLMFVDAIGLRPRIEEMADRVASWGYVVLAPNVFYRDGRAPELAPTGPLDTDEKRAAHFEHAMPRVHALTPERSDPDTDAYLAALTALDGVRAPVAVVGYCMGARLAMRAAGRHPDVVRACGGFHGGRLAVDNPSSPHHVLARARGMVCFGHADGDPSMPAEQIDRLQATLDDAGLTGPNEVYAGAAHGYTMADTAVYSPEADERHFRELRAMLRSALG